MKNRSVIIQESKCPYCDKPLNAAFSAEYERPIIPKKGDITFCLYCHKVLTYSKDKTLLKVSDEEIKSFPLELQKRIERIQEVLRLVDRVEIDRITVTIPPEGRVSQNNQNFVSKLFQLVGIQKIKKTSQN